MQVHSEEPSASMCRALPHLADQQRVRRIGFGEVVHTQALIDRTLAEVAGGGGGRTGVGTGIAMQAAGLLQMPTAAPFPTNTAACLSCCRPVTVLQAQS